MFLSFLQDLLCPWLVSAWKGKGAVNSVEIPCSLLWAGTRHSSPLALLFSPSSRAMPGFGQLGRPGRALQTETEPKQSPLGFQQRAEHSYELIVCAEHGWEGTLHEFLKQFSAKTAPSTTWNSVFQGKRAAWCGQLFCLLLQQLLWPELWAAPATAGLHQGRAGSMGSTVLPLLPWIIFSR